MRIEDYAGMDMFAWKGKARDIIPGWPRGRSTSRPCAAGTLWPWEYTYSLISGELLHVGPQTEWQGLGRKPETIRMIVGGGDFCFKHRVSCLQKQCAECVAERAEERRKAEMVDMYWREKRREASGRQYPLPDRLPVYQEITQDNWLKQFNGEG